MQETFNEPEQLAVKPLAVPQVAVTLISLYVPGLGLLQVGALADQTVLVAVFPLSQVKAGGVIAVPEVPISRTEPQVSVTGGSSSSEEDDDDGSSSSEEEDNGSSSSEEEDDGSSSSDEEDNGSSSSDEEDDGSSSSEEEDNGSSSSEEEDNGSSSSEEEDNGSSSSADEEDNGSSSSEEEDEDGSSSSEEEEDGSSSSEEEDGSSSDDDDVCRKDIFCTRVFPLPVSGTNAYEVSKCPSADTVIVQLPGSAFSISEPEKNFSFANETSIFIPPPLWVRRVVKMLPPTPLTYST